MSESITVTAGSIERYRELLRQISEKAAEEVQEYMREHKFLIDDAFLDFAYAISTKYGEAAGALSCKFFDELNEYWVKVGQGKRPYAKMAEPAKTATRQEVIETVLGAKKDGMANIPSAVGKLAKRTAEDTTLENAIRGGYEFAWVPSGDSCSFCMMLASNGWQRASKKALKKGHAAHIHPNCDCTYVVRFDKGTTVEGYDPDYYKAMYDNADGDKWQDKLNSMRRDNYAKNKDKINAQKRVAYKLRKESTELVEEDETLKKKIKEPKGGIVIDNARSVLDEYMENATPGEGILTYTNEEAHKKEKSHERDKESAEWIIKTFGGDVELLSTRRGKGAKTPDGRWKEKYIEFKKPTTENAVRKRVRKGISQIAAMDETRYGIILVDLSDRAEDIKVLIDTAVDEALKRSKQDFLDLIIRDQNEVVDVLRIKK